MKMSFRLPFLGALLSLALNGHAQVTYSSLAGAFAGETAMGGAGGKTALQTFSGFSNISSMTWQVKNTTGLPTSATFSAYIGEWNSAAGTLVGALTAFGTGNLSTGSVVGGATQNLTFNATLPSLSASTTYALLLTYTGGSADFVANYTANPGGDFFGSIGDNGATGLGSVGTTFFAAGSLGQFQTNLQTFGGSAPNSTYAYRMSVTGDLAPVPEPKTAAAAFAALFVAGLVGRRFWQQRKPVAQPLAA